MQQAVRDVSTVIDWMGGTRQLLEKDEPRFKAAAMQRLGLKTDAEWEAKRNELLGHLNASMATAQSHASQLIEAGAPPHSIPFVPADKFGATFQSAMEEHLNDRITSATQAQAVGAPIPYGPPEKFDSGDPGWALVLVARLDEAFGGKHLFVHATDLSVFRYDMPENTSVALFADWATGEPPALSIKAVIEGQSPEYTIHLGDTYYAGFDDEIRHNLVACWPGSVRPGKSFTLNGNHEMYSGGNAYFNALPVFGQSASYFNLGNQYWRLIALDTSYPEKPGDSPSGSWGELVDMKLSDGSTVREVDWLAAQVEHANSFDPPARIMLLTHHQLFSAFDGVDLGKYLLPQIKPFLDKDAIYAWFWGHEHRGIVYGPNATYNFKARCIGHAGFPQAPSNLKDASHVEQFPIAWLEDRTEPDNAWYGMRGFALLRLAGPNVWVDYIDETGSKCYSEQL